MERTQVVIIRHGQTAWNLAGKRQGHLDSPLTDQGVAQARALAGRLMRKHFAALYSSDLGRAYRTAQFIAEATGHEVAVDARLRERNLGVFQGLTGDEIQRRFPTEYRMHRTLGPDYVILEGESLRQQIERNIECLNELAGRHSGRTIVVVTHGGVLSGLFRHTFSIPLEAPRRFDFLNGGLNVFACEKNCWTLETWGDVSHLESALSGDGDEI